MYDRIEEIIEDLKQFIVVTVAQSNSESATKQDLKSFENRIENRLGNFENHINKRLDELDTKPVTIADAHSEILTEHESRLSRLEIKPA